MTDVPDEVRALAAERQDRRTARDFAAADALRDRIRDLGFNVIDGAEGPTFEPVEPEPETRLRPHDVESLLEESSTADVSVHWVVEGWPEDVVRSLAGFRAGEGGRDVQYVIADVTETDPATYGEGVELLRLELGTGWGAARNAGLRRSRGRIVLVVDGSIEPTGDPFEPLEAALGDPSVGVCGPFGISTEDLREFHDSAGGLHNALCRAFRAASDQERLGVLNAHPDLAGKLAAAKRLTADSAKEQASAGLDALTDKERELFSKLNAAYVTSFGFPFIIAVKGKSKEEIMAAFEKRIGNDRATEFATACKEVERIALLRLRDLLPS